jgi:hypothetical protein
MGEELTSESEEGIPDKKESTSSSLRLFRGDIFVFYFIA